MPSKVYHFLFLLMLIGFVGAKCADLYTPYFWDELGVYVPGALKMKDGGTIGLLPSSLEPQLSRGHPLLFVASQALFFKLFGDGVVSGHCFSLFLATVTLVVFFICSKNLFNVKVALIASLLLAVQPVFYSMAVMILPEMMLTLFTIPAIWGIIRKNWLVYMVFGSLAMLTKESAIVIPTVALLFILLEGFRGKDLFTLRRWKLSLAGLTPLLVYGAFLIIQRVQNGWFFFPEHMGYIRTIPDFIEHIWYTFRDLAFLQGRWLIGGIMIAGIIRELFIKKGEALNQRIAGVTSAFVLLCILFAAWNFYLLRYMLYVIPFVIMLGSYFLVSFTDNLKPVYARTLQTTGCCIAIILSLIFMDNKKFNDSADMSYKYVVAVEQEAISWAEQQPWRDSVIEANFPLFQGMSDERYGYLNGPPFAISTNFERRANYGLLFHLNNDPIPVWNGAGYKVIKTFDKEFAHVSVVEFEQ